MSNEINNKQCLSLKRIFLLIKSDLVLCRSAIFTTMAATASILLLYNLFDPNNIFEIGRHPTAFIWLLFGGGCWISSNAFRNFHENPKAYFFLMMPASSLEKFLARWFLTAIGFAISVLLFYSVFYRFIAAITLLLTQKNYFTAIPFSAHIWHLILDYIVLQSVFLLGSIYFKKLALIKTILAAGCVGILLVILAALVNKAFLHSLLIGNTIDLTDIIQMNSLIATVFYFVFSLLIAPISWITSYLRLREIEA